MTTVFGSTRTSAITPSIGALTIVGSFAITFTGATVDTRTGRHSAPTTAAAINHTEGVLILVDQVRWRIATAFQA